MSRVQAHAGGRVTVVLPTWNGERFLAAQLDSILSDLPADGRLIVRDDASSDGTTDIVKRFAERDGRIEFVPGETRLGVIRSVEILLGRIDGGFVFLADQDDIWRPGKIARCLDALEHDDLVVHDAVRIDAEGRPLEWTLFERRGSGGGVLANAWKNRFTGCCMAFRAELLRRILPFPKSLPMHDQWIGLVALRHGRVAWLQESLVDYRLHESNATGTGAGKTTAGMWRRIVWRIQALQALVR